MAKKAAASKPANTNSPARKRTGKAVRLDLSAKDHERLERCSEERGLSKSSYARMAVLALIKQDEEGSGK
jgi:hypothetical protein